MVEVGDRQREKKILRKTRATNKRVNFLSPSSRNCLVATVGGVGLSEVGGAVMKAISHKTLTGYRRLIDLRNFFWQVGEREDKKIQNSPS